MSLINDALKRANQAVHSAPPVDPGSAPLRPAESASRRSIWPWIGYGAALILATVLAGWAVIIGFVASHQMNVSSGSKILARENSSAPVSQQRSSLDKYDSEASEGTAITAASHSTVPTSVAAGSAPNQVATPGGSNTAQPIIVEPPKPAVPTFKLQGIFYRPTRPAAMVNSKMVFPGDKILDAKVLAIDQESVTLEREGNKLVLTLP